MSPATTVVGSIGAALGTALGVSLASRTDLIAQLAHDAREARCLQCGTPIAGHVRGACRRRLTGIDAVVVGGSHRGERRSALLRAKLTQEPEALDALLATLLPVLDGLPRLPPPGTPCIPIPSAWWRLLRRGGDHVRYTAWVLAERYGWTFLPVLKRGWRAGSKRGLTLEERRRQAEVGHNAMRSNNFWIDAEGVTGVGAWSGLEPQSRGLVLVDDVLTTGSTLVQAGRAVRGRGDPVSAVLAVALSSED